MQYHRFPRQLQTRTQETCLPFLCLSVTSKVFFLNFQVVAGFKKEKGEQMTKAVI
jgi:hypothetical protein